MFQTSSSRSNINHEITFTANVDNSSVEPTPGGYGATAARVTPDRKDGNSNLSAPTLECCHKFK